MIFKKSIARKIMDECIHRYNPAYIFRFERKSFKGYYHRVYNETLRDVTFMGYAINRKFVPSN